MFPSKLVIYQLPHVGTILKDKVVDLNELRWFEAVFQNSTDVYELELEVGGPNFYF